LVFRSVPVVHVPDRLWLSVASKTKEQSNSHRYAAA
jgi:hypothetical protein